jgi:peptide chain release factor 1
MKINRDDLQQKYEQLERDLQNPEVLVNPEKLKKISREYSDLSQTLDNLKSLDSVNQSLTEAETSFKNEKDQELLQLIKEEIADLTKRRNDLEQALNAVMSPPNPLDAKDIIIEIRAGAGGDEAALFAAELFRMYSHYAERQRWQTHLISSSQNGLGGLKEVIFEIIGSNVFSNLKYESGVHRVQRVPTTEKSGRIHTSTATVAVMPEADEVDLVIKPEDLDVQATTSSGHGGQSVNTTYSAIRIIHKPTGMIVTCQDERSQKQNKEKAMQVLRSRLLVLAEEKKRKENSEARKGQIGTGDRSEKIRTYNYPQDRLTDHRLKQNWHNIQTILDGNLDQVIESLKTAEQQLK